MKHMRTLYLMLLTLLGMSNVQAQTIEDGEAFYIYRNDGEFNGFFYDQVQEIRYSKLDMDGVEQAEYVVQEVVTADSLYRIPLAAIDSVGFVQPEIKFNPKVRHMDQLGMTPYLTGVKSQILKFDPTLPAEMIPQVGDVLIGFTGLLEKNGFGGRVTNVWVSEFEVEVTCERLTKMSDVFRQFISVEQIGVDESTNQVRRRVAGYKQMKRIAESGGLTANLININANLHIPFDTEVSIGTSIDAGVSFTTKMAMVYRIWNDDYWIRASLASDYSLSLGFTLKLSGNGDKTIPLVPGPMNAIKFPATCPFFEVRPAPSLGIRWAAEASASVQLPVKSGGTRQSIKIASDEPQFITYDSDCFSKSNGISSFFSESDVNFKIKGTVQAGIKSVIGIHTNSWFEKIFEVSFATDVWLGPKIDAEVVVDRGFFDEDDGPYTFRNNRFALSPLSLDWEAYASVNTMLSDPKRYTFADGSVDLMPSREFHMFPSFSSFEVNHDEKNGKMTARWDASPRTVFWSSDPGIVVYRKELPDAFLAADYAGKLSFGSTVPESLALNLSTKGYVPGRYYAAPVLSAFGGVYPVRSMKREFKVPVYLKVPEKVTAPSSGGKFTIPAETNGELRGSNEINLSPGSVFKKDIAYAVTAYAPNDDLEPVTETCHVIQDATGEGCADVEVLLWDRSLFDFGFVTYPGTKSNVGVTVANNRATISGSYSGSPQRSEDHYWSAIDITTGDNEGHTHTIHVDGSEQVSWNFNFVVDLVGELNRERLQELIAEAEAAPQVPDGPKYYYLAAEEGEEVTLESSGWTDKATALRSMSATRKILWKYTESIMYGGIVSIDGPSIEMTVPWHHKIISGVFHSSVNASASYAAYDVYNNYDRSASFRIKDGYMGHTGGTNDVWSGGGTCIFSENGVSGESELEYYVGFTDRGGAW